MLLRSTLLELLRSRRHRLQGQQLRPHAGMQLRRPSKPEPHWRRLNSVPQSWKPLEWQQKRRQGGKWRRPLQALTWRDSRLQRRSHKRRGKLRGTCLDPVLQ